MNFFKKSNLIRKVLVLTALSFLSLQGAYGAAPPPPAPTTPLETFVSLLVRGGTFLYKTGYQGLEGVASGVSHCLRSSASSDQAKIKVCFGEVEEFLWGYSTIQAEFIIETMRGIDREQMVILIQTTIQSYNDLSLFVIGLPNLQYINRAAPEIDLQTLYEQLRVKMRRVFNPHEVYLAIAQNRVALYRSARNMPMFQMSVADKLDLLLLDPTGESDNLAPFLRGGNIPPPVRPAPGAAAVDPWRCGVCMNEASVADQVFNPCGHRCCVFCYPLLARHLDGQGRKQCHICRVPVDSVIRTYR